MVPFSRGQAVGPVEATGEVGVPFGPWCALLGIVLCTPAGHTVRIPTTVGRLGVLVLSGFCPWPIVVSVVCAVWGAGKAQSKGLRVVGGQRRG